MHTVQNNNGNNNTFKATSKMHDRKDRLSKEHFWANGNCIEYSEFDSILHKEKQDKGPNNQK